jgi:putative Mg2+ transporter-C (MgtC) family protein
MPTPEIGVQLEALVRLALAGILGALVGYERQVRHRPAGLRTYILVSLGACLFTIVSILGFPGSDTSRVAAQIVTGIGFIGAGTIIQAQAQAQPGPAVRGVTTAAGIWAIAAVGMAAGTGLYVLAIVTAIAAFLVLRYFRLKADRGAPDES